jgi:DNA-binding response OmpR family regulator
MRHNPDRVLVVSGDARVQAGLEAMLSDRSCVFDVVDSRQDGAKKFRAHKQHLVILDAPSLGKAPQRLFRYIRRIRKNTITMVASAGAGEHAVMEKLGLDADALLDLSGNFEAARATLNSALENHRIWMRSLFLKHVVFFSALVLPVWLGLAWVVWRN